MRQRSTCTNARERHDSRMIPPGAPCGPGVRRVKLRRRDAVAQPGRAPGHLVSSLTHALLWGPVAPTPTRAAALLTAAVQLGHSRSQPQHLREPCFSAKTRTHRHAARRPRHARTLTGAGTAKGMCAVCAHIRTHIDTYVCTHIYTLHTYIHTYIIHTCRHTKFRRPTSGRTRGLRLTLFCYSGSERDDGR